MSSKAALRKTFEPAQFKLVRTKQGANILFHDFIFFLHANHKAMLLRYACAKARVDAQGIHAETYHSAFGSSPRTSQRLLVLSVILCCKYK
jgi:hypothetical protein